MRHIQEMDGQQYVLYGAVVMNNHAHMILQPEEGYTIANILRGIKGSSAHSINRMRKTKGTIWQQEYFDRIIRDEKELEQKLEYLINNPAKAGLIENPWEYPALFVKGNKETGLK